MKLVFTVDEVAEALGLTAQEFRDIYPQLERNGFPRPVRGMTNRWPILEVIRWVNNDETSESATQPDELAHLLRTDNLN